MATNPGCVNPGEIWSYNVPCTPTYAPFEPRPTAQIPELECPFTQMAPNKDDDPACWGVFSNQPSDCPEQWTSAGETTYEPDEGVTFVTSFCCPTVYPYTLHSSPGVSVITVDDTEYSVAINPDWLRWSSWCGATSVEALSDKTITMSVPGPSTTEAAWNYENGILVAPAAPVTKYFYEYEGRKSACSGICSPEYSNPLKPRTYASPTPTPAPTGTYAPPPSHATTQFTPGESCMADSMKWLVSTACNLGSEAPNWVECAITMTGNPHNRKCNPFTYTIGNDRETTFYDRCPVGYQTVSSRTYYPFFSVSTSKGEDKTAYSTTTYDAYDVIYACCPDGADFKHVDDGSYITTATNSNGETAHINLYVPPRCIATHVTQLADKDVPLTMFYNPTIPEKKKKKREIKRQDIDDEEEEDEDEDEETNGFPILGTTTRKWDVDTAILFAEPLTVAYTVFHSTYTCFENCREYFTYSYNNTDPNYTPTATRGESGTGTGTGIRTGSGTESGTGSSPAEPTETSGQAGRLGLGLWSEMMVGVFLMVSMVLV